MTLANQLTWAPIRSGDPEPPAADARDGLRAILDSTGDSICAIDQTYCLTFFNSAYAKGFQARMRYEPRPGMRVLEIFREDASALAEARKWWDRALAGEEFNLLRETASPQGVKRYFDVRFTPVRDEEGRRSGAISVTREITDLMRAEQALHEANQQLREANARLQTSNRELQRFAYVASHDLREPLRKIQVFADLVVDEFGEALGDEGTMFLDRMYDAAGRMMRLLEDLHALSRVKTHGGSFANADLGDIAREAVRELDAEMDEAGAMVEVGPMPVARVDAGQVHELFRHLIQNALKFRRPDVAPRIVVRGRRVGTERGKAVRVKVRDNGIGFDEKYLDRIFSPFERLHGRAAYDGTGMGLAICRRIVDRHGGSITAESEPGGGATFEVTLPDHE